jgi:hypothetical protein
MKLFQNIKNLNKNIRHKVHVFIHIPKTGGKSFEILLNINYNNQKIIPICCKKKNINNNLW